MAKEHHRKAGDHLIDPQEHDEKREQQRDDGGREHRDQKGDAWIAAKFELGRDAGQRTDQHEAFGSERQHARPLADDQPKRGKRIRRREARRSGQPIDGEMQHALSLSNYR